VLHARTCPHEWQVECHCRCEPVEHLWVVVGQDEALCLPPGNQTRNAETGTELKDRSCAEAGVWLEQVVGKHWQRAPGRVPGGVGLTLAPERQRTRAACA